MSLISFLKDAGEKMLHPAAANDGTAAPSAALAASNGATAPAGAASQDMRPKEAMLEQAILDYMVAQKLPTSDVTVRFDASDATVHLSGSVPDQHSREKMILCCGNVQGVAHVDDGLTVAAGETAASQYYTVQSGDSLSKIAQHFYGDAGKFDAIFEANQPMLSDPNRIYPGQTLRIPPQA